jgi:methionine synthase I (cobalamin-dependent)
LFLNLNINIGTNATISGVKDILSKRIMVIDGAMGTMISDKTRKRILEEKDLKIFTPT